MKNQNVNIDIGYLEFGYPIMVQSGGTYNLKMGAAC
jgi:nucleosome binding factor SPN SPT16 subunit